MLIILLGRLMILLAMRLSLFFIIRDTFPFTSDGRFTSKRNVSSSLRVRLPPLMILFSLTLASNINVSFLLMLKLYIEDLMEL